MALTALTSLKPYINDQDPSRARQRTAGVTMSKKPRRVFASADAKAVRCVFCRDMCVAENTFARSERQELSAISGQQRRRTQRKLSRKSGKAAFLTVFTPAARGNARLGLFSYLPFIILFARITACRHSAHPVPDEKVQQPVFSRTWPLHSGSHGNPETSL